jgi:hypothetical protein
MKLVRWREPNFKCEVSDVSDREQPPRKHWTFEYGEDEDGVRPCAAQD